MTIDDFKNLLALISSDRLTLRGNEAQVVASLQLKLAALIKPQEPKSGDSPGPTE